MAARSTFSDEPDSFMTCSVSLSGLWMGISVDSRSITMSSMSEELLMEANRCGSVEEEYSSRFSFFGLRIFICSETLQRSRFIIISGELSRRMLARFLSPS